MLSTQQLILMRRRYDCGPGKYVQQEFAIESRLFSEGDGLRNCLHVHTEQFVYHELHRGSGTARPHVKVLLRYHGKDWSAGVEHIGVAAAEKGQSALLRRRRAAGNCNVQDFDSALNAHPMEQSR